MRILAIDTADRDRITCVRLDAGSQTGRSLAGGAVDETLVPLLAELGLDGLDAVVVVIGPGSYTGVRGGMAAGLGVADAIGLPLHGVGALEVVAHGAAGAERVGAVAGAGRGGLYVAVYSRRGDSLIEVEAPQRVEAAGWRPEPGLGWVTLGPLPDGVAAEVAVADPVAALAAAARDAVRRPPLDRTRLRADLTVPGRSRSPRV